MRQVLSEVGSEPLLRPVMPELDSIRGIAIIAVLLYHGLYWSVDLSRFTQMQRLVLTATWTGRLGVNLFFVLSGFLITGLLQDSRNREDYYRRFYIRRALRIIPAYFLTLAILLIVRVIPIKFLLLSLAYLSNLTPLFGVAIAYPVLWSLAVEEHFYLMWPLLIRKLSDRLILVCTILIIFLSPLIRWISFHAASRKGWVSFEVFDYTWNSADGLACGALLAISIRMWRPSRKQLAQSLGWLVVIAMGIWALGFPFGIATRQRAIGAAFQVVPWHLIFMALIGGFLLVGSSPWTRWVTPRFLTFFGRISYGLYLYHLSFFWGSAWLVTHCFAHRLEIDPFGGLLVRVVLVGGISVVFSYLSRRYFEEPFLRLKDKFS